jgi:hypothetical protein
LIAACGAIGKREKSFNSDVENDAVKLSVIPILNCINIPPLTAGIPRLAFIPAMSSGNPASTQITSILFA